MIELAAPDIAFLLVAAGAAGWIDAVVGGGGLVQLPALLVTLPAAAPIQLLATNKLASVFGTTSSALTYVRRIGVDRASALALAAGALIGSAAGALVAGHIPRAAFNPIILCVLIGVGGYTLARPDLGAARNDTGTRRRGRAVMVIIGLVVGVYDGALGPGTGSFFVFALVGWAGFTFVEASARAKIANVATNVAALMVFIPQGAVLWSLGLSMAAANMLGGYVGARTAVARGSGFVRVVFVIVIAAFTVRIGVDVWADFGP